MCSFCSLAEAVPLGSVATAYLYPWQLGISPTHGLKGETCVGGRLHVCGADDVLCVSVSLCVCVCVCVFVCVCACCVHLGVHAPRCDLDFGAVFANGVNLAWHTCSQNFRLGSQNDDTLRLPIRVEICLCFAV